MADWFDGMSLQEVCAVCGRIAGDHCGASTAECPIFNTDGTFDDWSQTGKFTLKSSVEYDRVVSDPNTECKCGIKRTDCTYHKD